MKYIVSGFTSTVEQDIAIDLALSGNRKKRSLKLEAGAGSGKTSILKAIANYLDGKGLYIAFSSSIAEQAKADFATHVTSKTSHSLAFGVIGYRYRDRFGRLHGSVVVDHLNNEAYGEYSEIQLANLALATVRQFCYSADEKILYDHVPYLGKEDKFDPAHLVAIREQIVLLSRKIWNAMKDPKGKLPVTHDFYLKLWALTNPVLDYDFIFLDEAQDSNAVLIDLLLKQKTQIIWVGDRHQSIFGWRGAVNAMAQIKTDDVAQITQSFRFGPAVAGIANLILEHYLFSDFRIRGFSQVDSYIEPIALTEVDAIICRTNQSAMRETIKLMDQGLSATFVGDKDELISSIKAVGELKSKGFTLHHDFRAFTSYKELLDYASTDEGLDYSVLLKMVNEHGQNYLIAKLMDMTTDKDAAIKVITAHKSKGHEWNNVLLGEDFILPTSKRWTEEEGNLLYVAVTRAQKRLDITQLKPLTKLVMQHWKGSFTPPDLQPKVIKASSVRQSPQFL